MGEGAHGGGQDGRTSHEARLAALREARVVLVSACLLGERCRFDGQDKRSERVARALEDKEVVPVCPEAGAGLGIPRAPVELQGGGGADVLAGRAAAREHPSGVDRTDAFVAGAHLALAAARRFGATAAILKEKSPSCGSQRIYAAGVLREGQGVTAALLEGAGLCVVSDEEL